MFRVFENYFINKKIIFLDNYNFKDKWSWNYIETLSLFSIFNIFLCRNAIMKNSKVKMTFFIFFYNLLEFIPRIFSFIDTIKSQNDFKLYQFCFNIIQLLFIIAFLDKSWRLRKFWK